MNNNHPPDNEAATAATIETVGKPKWWQRLSRRVAIGLAAVCVILVVVGFVALGGKSHSESETELPKNTEQFEEWFTAIEKSPDTEARNDELSLDDSMLKKLTTVERLTTIQVTAVAPSSETMSLLAAMPHLEQLHLRGGVINDEMLARIASSKTIWILDLPVTEISPQAIEGLAKMPALRNLRLGIKDGDNRHSNAVASLSRLRAVHLISVAVTDEGLEPLAKMRQLESLYLDDTAVTETGWLWLFQANPQLHVHVNQKHHDRDPQQH